MNTQMCTICNKEFNVVMTQPDETGSELITYCHHCGNANTATVEVELTDAQMARCDEIYNAVHEMCKVLADDPELEYNMAYIGEIAEDATYALMRFGGVSKIRFPSVCYDDNYGSAHIKEYYTYDGS